jgi:hypothetical protein
MVNWKTDGPKRILGACQNPVIDPVNAARFMTVASTLQRRERSAALNAPYAVQPLRIGTPLGFLDIDSLPVQLRRRMTDRPKRKRPYILARSRFHRAVARRAVKVADIPRPDNLKTSGKAVDLHSPR